MYKDSLLRRRSVESLCLWNYHCALLYKTNGISIITPYIVKNKAEQSHITMSNLFHLLCFVIYSYRYLSYVYLLPLINLQNRSLFKREVQGLIICVAWARPHHPWKLISWFAKTPTEPKLGYFFVSLTVTPWYLRIDRITSFCWTHKPIWWHQFDQYLVPTQP